MNEEKCSVCLDLLNNKEDIYKTKCNHIFHKGCLKIWIKSNNKNLSCHKCNLSRKCFSKNSICQINFTCPLCRQSNYINIEENKKLLNLDEIECNYLSNIVHGYNINNYNMSFIKKTYSIL